MTDFRFEPFKATGKGTVVEVWEDGEMIGAIYPKLGGVRITSNYLDVLRRGVLAIDLAYPMTLCVNFILWELGDQPDDEEDRN